MIISPLPLTLSFIYLIIYTLFSWVHIDLLELFIHVNILFMRCVPLNIFLKSLNCYEITFMKTTVQKVLKSSLESSCQWTRFFPLIFSNSSKKKRSHWQKNKQHCLSTTMFNYNNVYLESFLNKHWRGLWPKLSLI